MTKSDTYSKARSRAVAKYSFFVHVAVYAAVMVLLVVINLVTSPDVLWFIWPLIGWGFAIALHGIGVFLFADKTSVLDALAERELKRLHGDGHPVDGAGGQQ